jgi:Fic family protein
VPEMLDLVEGIYWLNNAITALWDGIPESPRQRYFSRALVNEVMWSNDVEGIRSSKQELRAAFDAVTAKNRRETKFMGLVNGYAGMLRPRRIKAETPEDVRALYDVVLLPDLDASDTPDGRVFRKDGVSIVTGTGKEKHRGILPEEALIAFVSSLLSFVKGSNYSLASIAAFHFLFGFAHPFYDGNGRMMRFLSSAFLRENLNLLIGLNMSQVISSSKKAYYDAFEVCNDQKNKGDLTPFILYYLSTIVQSAEIVLKELEDAKAKLDFYSKSLVEMLGDETDAVTLDVLSVVLEATLFSDAGVGLSAISDCANISVPTARERLQKLNSLGIPVVIQKDGRQKVYQLNLEQ